MPFIGLIFTQIHGNFFFTFVILIHFKSNDIIIFLFFIFRGIIEVNYFWIFTSIYVLFVIYRLLKTFFYNNKYNFLPILFFSILKLWVISSCLLHRPHNVILLPIQLIIGVFIYDLTKNTDNIKVYLYIWSSNAFYFYQVS